MHGHIDHGGPTAWRADPRTTGTCDGAPYSTQQLAIINYERALVCDSKHIRGHARPFAPLEAASTQPR